MENPDIAEEIEAAVRETAGLLAEAFIGEPIPAADVDDDGSDNINPAATLGGKASA